MSVSRNGASVSPDQEEPMTVHDAAPESAGETTRRWLLVLVTLTAVAVLVLLLTGWADLLMPTTKDSGDGLSTLTDAVGRIRGPATAAFGSVSGLGLLAGGAMTALGMPQGIRMMTMSGLAGGGVLLGNGIVL
jgi:hypothetical protein